MIYDRYGRPLKSMRISITQKCNLDCIYCHREGVFEKTYKEMTPEEIQRITRICVQNGIKKVKITGGEPLVRADVCEIVERISSIEGVEDVSMTTNGVLLEKLAEDLKNSGLDRINISLDTLRPETFKWITRGGDLEKVVRGVDKAVEAGLRPVKLNMVVMKGVNDDEIEQMVKEYSREEVVIQLIELVDTDKAFFAKYFYDLDDIERDLQKKAKNVVIRRFMQGRRKYILNGSRVEVIKPMHNSEFCAHCTRIRITADGKFKPCLMRSDNTIDFLTPARNGATDEELNQLFLKAVENRAPYFKKKI
jgi:cyclic pyranopterin phosphate synthase